MNREGMAIYLPESNELEVIRPGESIKRKIRCINLNPNGLHVFGVEVDGDEIWVFVGPRNNPRPNRKFLYKFSSLTGGSSRGV